MGTHMKTTVEIADPLLREAKRAAERDGITLRELIEQGLRRAIDERNAATRKPYVLKDCSNKEGRLNPELEGASWEQMRDIIYGYDDPNSNASRLIRMIQQSQQPEEPES
jgi:hypothetical protein